jgi:hypothetical protein
MGSGVRSARRGTRNATATLRPAIASISSITSTVATIITPAIIARTTAAARFGIIAQRIAAAISAFQHFAFVNPNFDTNHTVSGV